MRRSFGFATTAAFAASLSTTLFAGTALAQATAARQQVIPAGQSASPTLTPGIRVGNMLFASGQLGMSADDVFNAYVKKNEVNFQRQESGYVTKDEADSKHI